MPEIQILMLNGVCDLAVVGRIKEEPSAGEN